MRRERTASCDDNRGRRSDPADRLARGHVVIELEYNLLRLPVVGEARLAVQVPNPTSFLSLSMRGLFVYDWTDIHRVRADAKGSL